MALSGLKDMSVINTPPKNRLPVKTYVGEFNEKYLKSAINAEIQRDGQVFYLYNRVESIYRFRDELQKLVPNASIVIAHGQMREGELEKVMCEFAQKKYDILLCTTIIESGLDLPNANTIIINDCDRFGLAQLYQLRGRVGRSDRQAYCYCFYKQSKEITPEAYKRLNAIKDFTTLGSGYHIALKDIEIRGVGNILGSKQHGHMVNVGFDTYCNLLEECINELKSKEPSKKPVVTTIDLNVTAFIPDEWVGSVEQKILEYKRLSDVKTLDELENMALSLKDRFSKLPKSVENLIKLIKLRLLANLCTITLIREAGDTIRVYTPFTLKEWLIIRNTLGENVKKYITFQNPPKALTDTKGILLVNKRNKNFDEIFNILGDLFYHINKVILDFNQKIDKKE
jgi:transcription-repair coupling factor (superfamily II helicase)